MYERRAEKITNLLPADSEDKAPPRHPAARFIDWHLARELRLGSSGTWQWDHGDTQHRHEEAHTCVLQPTTGNIPDR